MSVAQDAPAVTVSTTERQITAHGGAVLLRATAQAVGLFEAVGRWLRLKRRARGLSDGQFVLAVAESIALGARCLDDLQVARSDEAQTMLRGFEVPAPQTAGSWLRRFSIGHIRQLDKALAEVCRRAFSLIGVKQVTLDFDSSYIFSRASRRQGADRTYKKGHALPSAVLLRSFLGCVRARPAAAGQGRSVQGDGKLPASDPCPDPRWCARASTLRLGLLR